MSAVVFSGDRLNERVFDEIADLDGAIRRGIRQTWFSFARDLTKEARKEILRKPKSGRTYVRIDRAGRRRRHVASAPGETHANITGELRRSVTWKVHGADSMDFGYGIVGKPAPDRGEFLEFPKDESRRRPSLQNAIDKVQGNVNDHFDRHMLEELRPNL